MVLNYQDVNYLLLIQVDYYMKIKYRNSVLTPTNITFMFKFLPQFFIQRVALLRAWYSLFLYFFLIDFLVFRLC